MGINPLGGVKIEHKYDDFWEMVAECSPNKSGGDLANTKLFTYANDAVVKYDQDDKKIYFDNHASNAAYHPRWRTPTDVDVNNRTRYQLLKTIWENVKDAYENNVKKPDDLTITTIETQVAQDYSIESFEPIKRLAGHLKAVLGGIGFTDKELEKVFKMGDFDDSGKPLTFRRISAIHEALGVLQSSATTNNNRGVSGRTKNITKGNNSDAKNVSLSYINTRKFSNWPQIYSVRMLRDVYNRNQRMLNLESDIMSKMPELGLTQDMNTLFGTLQDLEKWKRKNDICSSAANAFASIAFHIESQIVMINGDDDRTDLVDKFHDYFSPVVSYIRNKAGEESLYSLLTKCDNQLKMHHVS